MGYAQLLSRAQVGLAAPLVRVEVHLGSGLPSFTIVGLPAPVVRESKERVRAALAHCGFEFPAGRITVNLAPADLPKEGGRFDLPIALGILVASGQVPASPAFESSEFYGELALTGELKPVPGLLLAALHAAQQGHHLYIPAGQVAELRMVEGLNLRSLRHLAEISAENKKDVDQIDEDIDSLTVAAADAAIPDLADVRGQHQARRALVIAAAGGHSLLFCGPPGSGKGMLARRLPGLLPPLSRAEALEVAAIAAVAQQSVAPASPGLPMQRPFRCPHHTASAHAIVGGGPMARPGEVSLAHRGVLFLDELPEFDRRVLESLREPLESGSVSIARAQQRADFPAAFQLVAAMNPCPCGNAGRSIPGCRCHPDQVKRYRARLSGPLLDRIDLQLTLQPVDPDALLESSPSGPVGLSTAQAREMVTAARERQHRRQGCLNAQLGPEETARHCRADEVGLSLLRRVAAQRGVSARSQHRVLRVARTIADLAGQPIPRQEEIAEALALRREEE
ncbi:MAG: YifB family Mg chelatase-like AAA ATPase [Nevskiaceae bacterium]|jgi:magnesium chelatase family protein|nr:YifB family Mg chelatase-like AAA ATPase [Nevskiaceae bacterium]